MPKCFSRPEVQNPGRFPMHNNIVISCINVFILIFLLSIHIFGCVRYRSAKDTILLSRRCGSFSSADLFSSWLANGVCIMHKVMACMDSSQAMFAGLWERSIGDADSPEEYMAAFDAWEAEVQASVPAERLLKFSVKEGWSPLVEFLGVSEPDVPFPRVCVVDVGGEMLMMRARMG